ncbi:MAG: DUF4838 domain-containing protein, partial [Planctomycetes bacterium]|nr:DUF4838 domain-containing protein [Planctomycetota bacterium]
MRCSARQRFVRGLVCSLGVVLAVAWAEAAELVIVQDGQPKATIVVAKDLDVQAAAKVKTAAEELQTYLQKISGAKLPIVTDADNPAGPLVLVGRSKLTDSAGVAVPSGLTPARREEGFVIVCKGPRLVLAGNSEGPYHGTEYAVYDFLRSLGVRWFMPGEFGEIVPQQKTIAVPEQQIAQKPDFVMRNWWLHTPPELAKLEARWKLQNKMNSDAMFAIPGDSSVRNVVAPVAMLKEKPELFALNENGSRNPYLPNLTNPEAVKIAADIIKASLRKDSKANSYGFAPDDGMPRDFNPETIKLNRGFTNLAGRPGVPGDASTTEEWIAFVNNVTAEVRKEFPQAYIATNGYANRTLPPVGVPLDDHLIIMFAAIWSCTMHAYDDPHCWQKQRHGEMLEQWCKQCKNVWIYGYGYNMLTSGLTAMPEFTKLRRDFPLMKKWGVMGFHDETRNVWAEAGIASRYLRAQLEWNADADVDAILEDFFTKWYGAAAAPMKAFYFALDECVTKTPMHGHEDRVLPEVYTPELLQQLQACLAKAEQLADTERTKVHVRADRLIYDHLTAYMAMSAADAAGNFAAAAQQAEQMLAIRKQLHTIDPSFIQPDEKGLESGVYYWGITRRKSYYQSLADKMAGKTGDLVAL